MSATLKEFLEACQSLGTLRLIVTSSAAVLEAKDTIENLFYAELPKGKYANMHKDTLEFHLNMDAIKQVKFETVNQNGAISRLMRFAFWTRKRNQP